MTDIRVVQSPVVHLGIGEHGPAPTLTARWDQAEGAWVDAMTELIIELEPAQDTVGFTLWQHGELVSSGTADRLTQVSVDLASLPDPTGDRLLLRTYRHEVDSIVLHDDPRRAGLSAPIPIAVPR